MLKQLMKTCQAGIDQGQSTRRKPGSKYLEVGVLTTQWAQLSYRMKDNECLDLGTKQTAHWFI